MRIEFSTEHETNETLAMIIDICERQIHSNERRVNDINAGLQRQAGGMQLQTTAREEFPLSAARAFGGGANVVPFLGAAVPPANSATAPAISTANPISAPVIAPPGAAGASTAGVQGAVNTSPTPPVSITPPANVPPAGIVERDSKGTPWDARIHSEAKTKNNDGTWRYKRKLDEAVKTAVLAEIVGTRSPVQPTSGAVPPPPVTVAGAVPPPPPPVPPVSLPANGGSNVPLPPPNVGVSNPSQPGVVPRPPVNPTVLAPVQSSAIAGSSAAGGASPSRRSFGDLVAALNQGLSTGKISQDQLQAACADLSIPAPAALASAEYAHLIDPLFAKLFPEG